MEFSSECKPHLFAPTTTLNSGATADITGVDSEIDTAGFDTLVVVFQAGTIASGGELSVAKLQASDTSGSGFADVTGAALEANVFGDTDDDKFAIIQVDLRGANSKRYWLPVASTDASANCDVTVFGWLARGDVSPFSDDNLKSRVYA